MTDGTRRRAVVGLSTAFTTVLTTALSAGLVGGLTGCAGGVRTAPRIFTPPLRPTAWERWRPLPGGGVLAIDHRPFEAVLRNYLHQRSDRVRLFAYGAVQTVEREGLDDYIRSLTGLAVTRLAPSEQYAFWLNLHNALVLRAVIARYLVTSFLDVDLGGRPFHRGPWFRKLVEVEGVPLSIADIRHRILRPLFLDPRMHYAMTNAAIGGPNLPARAFAGGDLDRRLDQLATSFVSHPRAVRVEEGTLVLSSLFKWYAADFGGTRSAVINHLRLYLQPPLVDRISPDMPIRYAFDWSLDDATGLRN